MKKILYLINSFNTAGAEKAMLRICSAIDKRRYDLTVLALHEGDGTLKEELAANNIQYRSFGITSSYHLPGLYRLCTFLRKNNDATLVTSLFRSNFWGRIFGTIAGMNRIVNWQNNCIDMDSIVKRHLLSITNPFSDIIIADSEAVQEYYLKRSYCIQSPVKVVPINAVQVENFYTEASDGDNVTIASVGRFTQKKRFDRLVQIAANLTQTGFQIQIAGDGDKREEVEQLSRRLGVENRIDFRGFVKDIPQFLASADIYVQTSEKEGSCIAVVEAMAASLPVIAFDVGGIGEAVVDEENGYVIPEGDTEQFTDRLRELIDAPEQRRELGERSRELAVNNHDIADLVQRFTDII